MQRVDLPDGRQLAIAQEVQEPEPAGWTSYETTWQEHLDAIRDGRRKLLDAEIIKDYWYEMALEDGSKTLFSIGGGPLDKDKAAALSRTQPAEP